MHADDVAAAIAQISRRSQKPYAVYELAGPRVYSYEELLRTIARIAGILSSERKCNTPADLISAG